MKAQFWAEGYDRDLMPEFATVGHWGDCLHMPSNSRLASGLIGGKMPALFLDRDGVIVEDVHYLRRVSDLVLVDGIADAIRRLQSLFYIVVVTNQSGIGRGYLSEEDLLDIHGEMVRQLSDRGAVIDLIYYCPHHPAALLDAYRKTCGCRKPAPGMIHRAAAEWSIDLKRSFLIGDSTRDVESAENAGVRGFLLARGRDPLKEALFGLPDDGQTDQPTSTWVLSDLRWAATKILMLFEQLQRADG